MKKPENRRPKAEIEREAEAYADGLFGEGASEALKEYREMGGTGEPAVHVLISSYFRPGQPSTGALPDLRGAKGDEVVEEFEAGTSMAEIAAWSIQQKGARIWLSSDRAEVAKILGVLLEEGENDGSWHSSIRDGEILLSLRFVRKGGG